MDITKVVIRRGANTFGNIVYIILVIGLSHGLKSPDSYEMAYDRASLSCSHTSSVALI